MSESLESVLISSFALISFKKLIQDEIPSAFVNTPFFYFNSAALLYFLGSLGYFAFLNLIEKRDPFHLSLAQNIHYFLNIVFNIIISIGFWKTRKV